MPYVERDAQGKIKGAYNRPQPGYAVELLPDDAPEIVAFLEDQKVPPPRPKAPPPPSGNTIAALRAEVTSLRQAMINAGILAE